MKYYLSTYSRKKGIIPVIWTEDRKKEVSLEEIDKFTTEFRDEEELKSAFGRKKDESKIKVRYELKGGKITRSLPVMYSEVKKYLELSYLESYLKNMINITGYTSIDEINKRRNIMKAFLSSDYGKTPSLDHDIVSISAYLDSFEDKRAVDNIMQHFCDALFHEIIWKNYNEPYELQKDKNGIVVTRYRKIRDLGTFIFNQENKYEISNTIEKDKEKVLFKPLEGTQISMF